MSVFAKLKAVN